MGGARLVASAPGLLSLWGQGAPCLEVKSTQPRSAVRAVPLPYCQGLQNPKVPRGLSQDILGLEGSVVEVVRQGLVLVLSVDLSWMLIWGEVLKLPLDPPYR